MTRLALTHPVRCEVVGHTSPSAFQNPSAPPAFARACDAVSGAKKYPVRPCGHTHFRQCHRRLATGGAPGSGTRVLSLCGGCEFERDDQAGRGVVRDRRRATGG
jgi:hypothetical protein